MIKVLVVDDEELLRRGLIALMDWSLLGFKVVGEASNGVEALNFVKHNTIDVIITDMRMPIENGIELMKHIKESGLNIKIIILSGYDDFTYAQKALEYGASSYVLKPVEEEEMQEALLKVRKEIEKERDELKLRNLLTENAKENFLRGLIQGNINEDDHYYNHLEDLSINFDNEDFCVAILSLESNQVMSSEKLKNEKAFLDILTKDFYNNFTGEMFNLSLQEFIYIFNGCESILDIQYCFEGLRQSLGNSFQDIFTVGIGSSYESYRNINKSYGEAREALKYKITFGKGSIIDYNRIVNMDKNISKYPLDIETKIFSVMSNGTIEDMTKYISLFFEEICRNKVLNCDNLKQLIQELIISFKHTFYSEMNVADLQEIINYLNSVDDIKTLEKYIIDFFIHTHEQILCLKYTGHRKVVEDVKEYINDNFWRKITLDDISEKFFISKSHFCRVFKEEMGMNLYKYLNTIRIEKAKSLLKNSYLKNYEICYNVGFESNSYFNQLFKKITGKTPSEYRNGRNTN